MQASDSELNSEEAAAYLFSHETSRVFHDRLVNEQDRELFFQILSNELHSYFKVLVANVSREVSRVHSNSTAEMCTLDALQAIQNEFSFLLM